MNQITRVDSPFGGAAVAARPNAPAQSDQQRAIAEVQAAMMIARANPRDQMAAMDRILNSCQRQSLAEVAIYSYSRGGSEITGPSIRLAEALAQSWGNIQFGIRELDQSGGESVVQAFAWDVETNVRREMIFTVPHLRHTRKGSYKLEDPRDIYEMVANNGARRLRACLLAVIPGDVVEAAVSQCEETMRARADTSPDAIRKMVDAFSQFGVTREQIEVRIQRRLDSIQPAQVVSLKKIYTSLRDGMSTPADWFDPIEIEGKEASDEAPAKGNSAAKDALRKAKEKAKEKEAAEPPADTLTPDNPAAAEGPADEQRGDQHDGTGQAADEPYAATVSELIDRAAKAGTIIDLKAVEKDWQKHMEALSDAENARIEAAIAERREQLTAK